MIGRTLRSFRIKSKIGEGGMGVVYLAEHTELPKRFAIKSLSRTLSSDPDFRARFYREAQNQALLDDPHIVQVTDFFEEDGQFFLVMEYVDGQDLSRVIKTRGKLPQAEALSIFKGILGGVEFAHSKGIIHRDIKPSNVLIDHNGRARIMDFGIAILAGAGDRRLTATGTAVGSPWYMSPEQITHPQEVDRRSDIYSLGIVLYEMLTGEAPFDGETDFSVKNQQVNAPAPDPRQKNPAISSRLAEIILKALAKEPQERFQGCPEFLQRIEALETPRPSEPKQLRTLVLSFVSVGLLLYLIVSLGRQDPSQPPNGSADEAVQVQRQAAFNLIQSASEKAWFVCKEFERVKLKERGPAAARLIGDTNLEEQLRTQIQDHKKNIAEATSGYSGFLVQLANLKDEIVEEEFDAYARFLERKKSFEQIRTTRLTRRHYQHYRKNSGSVNNEMMHEACAQELG